MRTLAIIFIFVVGLTQRTTAFAETKNLFTSNKKAAEVSATLNQHLTKIAPDNKDKVKLISDGKYGLSTRSFPPWRTEFELPKGGMFTLKPKAGAWENYKIKEIQPAGVMIEYEVGLSHQSLGNDVLIKDTGDIFLKYK